MLAVREVLCLKLQSGLEQPRIRVRWLEFQDLLDVILGIVALTQSCITFREYEQSCWFTRMSRQYFFGLRFGIYEISCEKKNVGEG